MEQRQQLEPTRGHTAALFANLALPRLSPAQTLTAERRNGRHFGRCG